MSTEVNAAQIHIDIRAARRGLVRLAITAKGREWSCCIHPDNLASTLSDHLTTLDLSETAWTFALGEDDS